MEINVPLSGGISLQMANASKRGSDYPSSLLQKGLILVDAGRELAEEGVGFGVPILKLGQHTVFAGDLDLSSKLDGEQQTITARFEMNLVEKVATSKTKSIESKPFYHLKNSLAWVMRAYPRLRGLLTAISNGLRVVFNWQTTYKRVDSYGEVKVTYHIRMAEGIVNMTFDLAGVVNGDITEVVVMNEQGANFFTRYQDSDGHDLLGEQIGCWDEVNSESATFICDQHRLAFSLVQVKGTQLFRGRELIGNRLAWAGFGYTCREKVESFSCTLIIERMP